MPTFDGLISQIDGAFRHVAQVWHGASRGDARYCSVRRLRRPRRAWIGSLHPKPYQPRWLADATQMPAPPIPPSGEARIRRRRGARIEWLSIGMCDSQLSCAHIRAFRLCSLYKSTSTKLFRLLRALHYAAFRSRQLRRLYFLPPIFRTIRARRSINPVIQPLIRSGSTFGGSSIKIWGWRCLRRLFSGYGIWRSVHKRQRPGRCP